MDIVEQAGFQEPIVKIKKLGQAEIVELPLSEFLKVILSELPNSDTVNNEIRLKNGDVYIPSSLNIAEAENNKV